MRKNENKNLKVGATVKITQKDAPYNSTGKTGVIVEENIYKGETWYLVKFGKSNPRTPYESWFTKDQIEQL